MIATGNHDFERFAALCNTLSGAPRALRAGAGENSNVLLRVTLLTGNIPLCNHIIAGAGIKLLVGFLHLLDAAAGGIVEFLCIGVQNVALPHRLNRCGSIIFRDLGFLLRAVGPDGAEHVGICIPADGECDLLPIGGTGDVPLHIRPKSGDLRVPEAAEDSLGGMAVAVALAHGNDGVFRVNLP